MPPKGATKDQDTNDEQVADEATVAEAAAAEADAVEGADNGATAETNGRKGKMPTYELQAVEGDELPADEVSGRGRMYHDLLVGLRSDENVGKWFQIAEFKTPNGARQAAKELASGKRDIPEGEWEFETRKFASPENPTKRWSRLYARCVG